mgnify:CR=1 FL=1
MIEYDINQRDQKSAAITIYCSKWILEVLSENVHVHDLHVCVNIHDCQRNI